MAAKLSPADEAKLFKKKTDALNVSQLKQLKKELLEARTRGRPIPGLSSTAAYEDAALYVKRKLDVAEATEKRDAGIRAPSMTEKIQRILQCSPERAAEIVKKGLSPQLRAALGVKTEKSIGEKAMDLLQQHIDQMNAEKAAMQQFNDSIGDAARETQ